MLLSRTLRVLEFSDAEHVLNLKYPGRFSVKSKSKRGPAKMPDYVGRLQGGGFVVLECKGTQGRVSYLDQAMATGSVQKHNLIAATKTVIAVSLVGGTFIPQWESPDDAAIRFADPPSDDLAAAVREMSTSELEHAIVQVAVAKQLALTGATEAANYLVSTNLDQSRESRLDRALLVSTERTETLRAPRFGVDGQPVPSEPSPAVRFSIDAGPLANSLIDSDSIQQAIARLRDSTLRSGWIHRHARARGPAELITPYGVRLSVQTEPTS
jgi:hypothetical protein